MVFFGKRRNLAGISDLLPILCSLPPKVSRLVRTSLSDHIWGIAQKSLDNQKYFDDTRC